jgi:hypothetical protein
MDEFWWQEFDGNFAFKAWIVSTINGCHASAAKFSFDFVASDFVSLHKTSIPIQ